MEVPALQPKPGRRTKNQRQQEYTGRAATDARAQARGAGKRCRRGWEARI